MATNKTLLTIPMFCEKHPAFTEGGIRWLRFTDHENGYGSAFVKLGRRVLVWEERFFDIATGDDGGVS